MAKGYCINIITNGMDSTMQVNVREYRRGNTK